MNPQEPYSLIVRTEHRGMPIVFTSGVVDAYMKDTVRRAAMTVVEVGRKLIEAGQV